MSAPHYIPADLLNAIRTVVAESESARGQGVQFAELASPLSRYGVKALVPASSWPAASMTAWGESIPKLAPDLALSWSGGFVVSSAAAAGPARQHAVSITLSSNSRGEPIPPGAATYLAEEVRRLRILCVLGGNCSDVYFQENTSRIVVQGNERITFRASSAVRAMVEKMALRGPQAYATGDNTDLHIAATPDAFHYTLEVRELEEGELSPRADPSKAAAAAAATASLPPPSGDGGTPPPQEEKKGAPPPPQGEGAPALQGGGAPPQQDGGTPPPAPLSFMQDRLVAAEVLTLWDVENVEVPPGVQHLETLRLAIARQIQNMGLSSHRTTHNLHLATSSEALFTALTRLNKGGTGRVDSATHLHLSRPKKEAADHTLRTVLQLGLERRRSAQLLAVMRATSELAQCSPWDSASEQAERALAEASKEGRLVVLIVTNDQDFLEHVGDVLRAKQRVVVCMNPKRPQEAAHYVSAVESERGYLEYAQGGSRVFTLQWDMLMSEVASVLEQQKAGK
jgi:hypothetical protein